MTLDPLRPYQTRALELLVDAAHRWSARKAGYGLLAVAPTGAGKTRLALELATRSIAKGRRVLWLAPRTELINQPLERLHEAGWHDVQVLQADRPRGEGPITVASIQTLVARGELPEADLVILDEARHYVAQEWGAVAARYLGSVRVGLDATPARADGAALGDLFDELIEVATIQELTALGWLVPARVIGPAQYEKKLCGAGPVQAYLDHTPQGRALCFCTSRRHAADTAAEFRAAGVEAVAV
ncbi:DEAD/DEAH box helicase family protein, partial [Patescibacteria group bacterium]|nr:DEAD/DEAH box helicase family protein [Patescibacteria group bacterium]